MPKATSKKEFEYLEVTSEVISGDVPQIKAFIGGVTSVERIDDFNVYVHTDRKRRIAISGGDVLVKDGRTVEVLSGFDFKMNYSILSES